MLFRSYNENGGGETHNLFPVCFLSRAQDNEVSEEERERKRERERERKGEGMFGGAAASCDAAAANRIWRVLRGMRK
jgi:hypothetical protein